MSTPTAPLQVAVLGAGAVGCFYGGMLARARHRVTLIGRPQHVQVFEAQGLRMQTLAFDETVKVQASTDAAAVAGADLRKRDGPVGGPVSAEARAPAVSLDRRADRQTRVAVR